MWSINICLSYVKIIIWGSLPPFVNFCRTPWFFILKYQELVNGVPTEYKLVNGVPTEYKLVNVVPTEVQAFADIFFLILHFWKIMGILCWSYDLNYFHKYSYTETGWPETLETWNCSWTLGGWHYTIGVL